MDRKRLTTEVAVSLAVVLVVGCIAFVSVQRTSELSRQVVCIENLREIAEGLAKYYTTFHKYPDDSPVSELRKELIPFTRNASVFKCPNDQEGGLDSYQKFYVRRPSTGEPDREDYVIGCPRHRGNAATTNLFSGVQVRVDRIAGVRWTCGDVKLGHEVAGGTLALADGSELALVGQHRVAVIQSFHQPSGALYSVVRVLPGRFGTVVVNVKPGGRLELLTPAAIIATLGTQFEVTTTLDGGTVVEVHNGSVRVQSLSGKTVVLRGGNKAKIEGSLPGAARPNESAGLIRDMGPDGAVELTGLQTIP